MKKTDDNKRASVIAQPDDRGRFPLYPATFGLLEWLQAKRKNPLLCGGSVELKHALELCLAFTLPSSELCKIPDREIDGMVDEFKHALTPPEFHRIQKYAECELMKFQDTATMPKKPQAAARKKPPKK